ncbi:10970_t:CDS:2, partial [Funneliformis caledonium]
CCCLVTDIVIDKIAQYCSSLEFLGIQSTNVSKDALSKLNPKIKIKWDSYLWLTYVNFEDIIQYCKDKIKDEYYQKLIMELEQNMRGMAERFGLMVRMYELKEKINYQLINLELDTNYAITEFVSHDIKYRGKELSSHMKFQTPPE